MTDERGPEDRFFEDERVPAAGLPPRPRRRSGLLDRSPAFAAVVLVLSGWLAASLWSDAAYFFSSRAPIDLGGPGALRLDAARENRLAQVRGELADPVPVIAGRNAASRTVGRIAGTNLLVDRPGRGGPTVYEGRILPARASGDYAEVAALMRQRGASLGDRFLVLRDGERPLRNALPVAGLALALALAAVNLRALLKRLFSRAEPQG